MARVVIEHVTKLFPGPGGEQVTALRDVSLTVADKEIFVVVGPSGCGKTTLLRLIAGLEQPTSGKLTVGEQFLNATTPATPDVAMVFQHPALYPHLSVYENLAFGLRLRRCPKPEIVRRVDEAAETLGLAKFLQRRPMALSGGQRQRVALGRAIVRRPKLILYDEPLSNLDPHLRNQLRLEIYNLHKRCRATAIYVTHDQAEAMLLGERVAVLDQGVIQQVDQPANLYRHPANLFVAGFFGSPPMNFFKGGLSRSGGQLFFVMQPQPNGLNAGVTGVLIADGARSMLSDLVGQKVVMGLRPEHIRLPLPGNGHVPAEDTVMGVVKAVNYLGAETHLRLAHGEHEFIARALGNESFSSGKVLELEFKMDQAHFFDPNSGKRIGCP